MKYLLLLATIACAIGCRSSKQLKTVVSSKDSVLTFVQNPSKTDSAQLVHTVFDKIDSNTVHFNTFSSKVKVDYKDSKKRNYDFNAFIRIQKDSTIWVSIIAALGIEAFRVNITPDSIKIINRLDKIVQFRSVDFIKEIIQLPVDFYTLQNLLVGNPVFLDSSNVLAYRESDKNIWLTTTGTFFKQLLSLNKGDYSILHSKLDDVDLNRNRTADFSFEEYIHVENRLFSTNRKIVVAEKNRIEISLVFRQPVFDSNLAFPFNIPKSYTQK